MKDARPADPWTTTADQRFLGVTIDGAHSRDLDDAIWVTRQDDGWQVTVSVADVCGAVAMASPEDAIARATGFTRYAATRTLRPMLPRHLSERELTLLPGRHRKVMAVVMNLSEELAVTKTAIEFGTLENQGRLTHEQASALIDGHGEAGLRRMMAQAWDLATRLLHKRRRGGAITFFSAASGMTTDEEGALVDTGLHGPVSRAYIVVQEMMILANASMAETFAGHGVPLLYRNHRANRLADRDALREDIERVVDGATTGEGAERTRLGMMLGSAQLGPTVTGHYGLNLPVYAWFTSPIRRYADLVNQRIVRAFLTKDPPPYAVEEIERIAHDLNAAVRLDATERSAAFKQASERRAKRTMAKEDFARLDAATFQAVVKAAFAEDAAPVSDALRSEVLSRLGAGTLTAKDVARVLMSANEGRAAMTVDLLTAMTAAPALASSVLNHLAQAHGLTGLGWTDASAGPPHAPTFRSEATASILGSTLRAGEMKATRQTEARHRASLALLSLIAGSAWQPPADWIPATEPADATRQPPATTATQNAKGRLQEMCQARRWAMPVYDVAQAGPPHAPTFRGTVSIRPTAVETLRSPEVSGTSRKETEHRAAAGILKQLSRTV